MACRLRRCESESVCFLTMEAPAATAPIEKTAKPISIRFMYALKRVPRVQTAEDRRAKVKILQLAASADEPWLGSKSRLGIKIRPLDRHLSTDLDHAPGGDLEIVDRVVRRPAQHDKQAVLPARHARLRRRLQRAPRDEER